MPNLRSPWLWGAAALLLPLAACASEVVDRTASGTGTGEDVWDGTSPPDTTAPPEGDVTTGCGATVEEPPSDHLECSGASGSCISDEFPEGESCYECSCRCCSDPDLEAQCAADPACAEWLDCMRSCEGAEPCSGCAPPCDTGVEPACYLADCHNWVCPHACGSTF